MKKQVQQKISLAKITTERERTNLLKKPEQNTLAFLVQHIPSFISSDGLTIVGLAGSLVILASFILAKYIDTHLLLLGIAGFIINWFGDSLDGRLAYYRKRPRKWYGFTLDVCVDWISVVCIGIGYVVYAEGFWELSGLGFAVLYGWSMLIALLRYKVTNIYSIDSGIIGPTEVRVILSLVLACEVLITGSILYLSILSCVILLIINTIDFLKLLKMADMKDKEEKCM